MLFVWVLALAGLFLIFLEFVLSGGLMAIGGTILLCSSLFLFHMTYEGTISLLLYFLGLSAATIFVARLGLWRAKASEKKRSFCIEMEGHQAIPYLKELIGKKGYAATDLKPTGHIWVEDRTFQAVSKTGPIHQGVPIQIVGGQDSHLIVTAYNEGSS